MDEKRLTVSIVGDSISTYAGYIPDGYLMFYEGEFAEVNGLKSVHDTWWMGVINGLNATLGVDNAFSASLVTGGEMPSSSSKERCAYLDQGVKPDLVLVYMGTNDRTFDAPIDMKSGDRADNFYGAYRTMLKQIKANYPKTKIVCATLLTPYERGREDVPTGEVFKEKSERYLTAIRKAVEEEGCYLADLAKDGKRYESLDMVHPTAKGHKLMTELWLKALEKIL